MRGDGHRRKLLRLAAAELKLAETRHVDYLADVEQSLADGFPAGAGHPANVVWCERHEREVSRCHHDNLICQGVPVPNDTPTERAALGWDPARAELQAHDRDVEMIYEMVRSIINRMSNRLKAVPALPPPDPPGCESCARAKEWEPLHLTNPTDVGGRLDTPLRLGYWCYRFVQDVHQLPTLEQVRSHHRRGAVRRKAS